MIDMIEDGGGSRASVRTLYARTRTFPAPPGRLQRWWQRLTVRPQERLARGVRSQCLTTLTDALKDGAAPNTPVFDDGATALDAACQEGWLGGIEALLAAGADASVRAPDGVSVAVRAAGHGLALVTRLLQAGATLGENGRDIDIIHAKLPHEELRDQSRGAWKRAWKQWAQDLLLARSLPDTVAPSTRARL